MTSRKAPNPSVAPTAAPGAWMALAAPAVLAATADAVASVARVALAVSALPSEHAADASARVPATAAA
ncbi:hypothetical protein ACIRSU_34905 [Streptomyces sp. NPDC101160]|uniref:hypothetical protein n=1 Tax=Streptomyces sp. NPDC101160 TaxID=3366118 RepID=UPI0037FFB6D6